MRSGGKGKKRPLKRGLRNRPESGFKKPAVN
jgi:hypothetical protein